MNGAVFSRKLGKWTRKAPCGRLLRSRWRAVLNRCNLPAHINHCPRCLFLEAFRFYPTRPDPTLIGRLRYVALPGGGSAATLQLSGEPVCLLGIEARDSGVQ